MTGGHHAGPGTVVGVVAPSPLDAPVVGGGRTARRPWLTPALVGVGIGLTTAYVALADPNDGGVFPACPLRELTGLDCPGCGGLRATHALAHGDLAGAFDHNAVLAVLLPLAAVLWVWWLVRSIAATRGVRRERGAPPAGPGLLARLPAIPSPPHRLVIGLTVLVSVFAVLRNITAVDAFAYLNSTA